MLKLVRQQFVRFGNLVADDVQHKSERGSLSCAQPSKSIVLDYQVVVAFWKVCT